MNSSPQMWPVPIALMFELLAMTSANSAQYVVDGLALGNQVALNSQNYRSYNCKPSDDFADLTWCSRSQQRGSKGRNITVSNTIAHTPDGTALYLMANAEPVILSRTVVEAEITQLTQEIGEYPANIEWFPKFQRSDHITSVIVYWGKIKLDELGWQPRYAINQGESPRLGVLVDTLGDPKRSALADFPIYRIIGDPGYIYSASFDETGRGHRHYVAIDGAQLTAKYFQLALQRILQKDQSLQSNDYQLWAEVAAATRALSRDTSPALANRLLNKGFEKFQSKKLRSRVWSILPGGAIGHLAMHQHGTIDIYGPKTEHPDIRRTIQRFIADYPSEPFVEFLHYALGDYNKALQANPNSVISDVLHYAIGYDIVGSLAKEVVKIVKPPSREGDYEDYTDGAIGFLNRNPELYDNKPLSTIVPNFVTRAATAESHFEIILRNGSSRHADDAAYMLGWLAFHRGKPEEALGYFSQAMVLGNSDYNFPATRMALRILRQYSPREQMTIVESNPDLAHQPALWYVAARAAYRDLDYALAMDAAQRALKALNVPPDRLPATTDPKRIDEAIQKINPELRGDYNMSEIPYLLEASLEISQYLAYLKLTATERPDTVINRARGIIIKYSKLIDDQERAGQRGSGELVHRDLRQALHLIDMTLWSAPKNAQYARLREWLYYRKARISAVFAPETTREAIVAMEREFPNSRLLPNALAEELYAEGVMMRDLNTAQRTFQKLLGNYPTSNAIDNAYTWMAIIFRCEGRADDAQNMNRTIISRFPGTRHAMYAVERMANPTGCGLEHR